MILHGNTMWTSPYALSSFVALREKGLEFEVREVALETGAHREPGFARASLTSRVPLLVDGAFAISESSAIAEYLEDAYPSPTHPRHSARGRLPAMLRARAAGDGLGCVATSGPIREERSAEWVFYPHGELAPLALLSPAGLRAADKLLAAADTLVFADAAARSAPGPGAWPTPIWP